jgi:hypothetical protein
MTEKLTEKLTELLSENPRGRLSRSRDEVSGWDRINKAPGLPRRYSIFHDELSGE